MNTPALDSAEEIEKIAKNLLLASKAWGKFPTPVDRIVQFADLQVENGIDLSEVEPGFFTEKFEFAKQALLKVLGIVDFRHKTIYLDQTQNAFRKNFVKLHEVGHKACSWQSDLGYMDDEQTLDPSVDDLFEREASYFSSGALFQLERFDDDAASLPLCIKSPQVLAQKFGGSNHASIRRYVERSKKRCAVLVLNKPTENSEYSAKVRNYFQSPSFTAHFGEILWANDKCGLEWVFIHEIKRGRKWHEDGQVALLTGSGETVTFMYHFFNNTYNTFVLLMPVGEKIKSRTVIVPR